MKNLHILPAKDSQVSAKGQIYLATHDIPYTYYPIRLVRSEPNSPTSHRKECVRQELYITSDEEIKEGHWVLYGDSRIIKIDLPINKNSEHFKMYGMGAREKIILTTDQDLIKNGVQAIDDEFLEWFIKNPSCELVNIRKVANGVKNHKLTYEYKIIIPKEEPKQETFENHYLSTPNPLVDIFRMKLDNHPDLHKQETLEEAAELYKKLHEFRVKKEQIQRKEGFIDGAKWQQERSYSEEDLKNAFDSAREFNSLDGVVDVHIVLPMGGDMSDLQPLHFTFDEWFEQFKKK